MSKIFKVVKIILRTIIALIILLTLSVVGVNLHMTRFSKQYIYKGEVPDTFDAIVVLGASVRPDGSPSPMLQDRLDKGIHLYNTGVSSKIIMSGDNSSDYYNEVIAMKNYATNMGVPSEQILVDHYGIHTYESMYRLKEVFDAKKVIVVTQDYHLYRAIYIARKLGIDAYGADASTMDYSGQFKRDIREVLARYKDYFKTMFKVKVDINDEKVSIYDDGNNTNEK